MEGPEDGAGCWLVVLGGSLVGDGEAQEGGALAKGLL